MRTGLGDAASPWERARRPAVLLAVHVGSCGRFAPGPLRAEAHFGGGAVVAGTGGARAGESEGAASPGTHRHQGEGGPVTPGMLGLRHLEHPRQSWVVHVSGTLPRGAACGGDGAWGGCPALASDRGLRRTPARRGLRASRGPWSARVERGPGVHDAEATLSDGWIDGFSSARRPTDPPVQTPVRPRARPTRGVFVSLISVFIKKTSETKKRVPLGPAGAPCAPLTAQAGSLSCRGVAQGRGAATGDDARCAASGA